MPEEITALGEAEDLQSRAWGLAAVAAGLLRPEEQAQRARMLTEAVRVCIRWSGTDDDFIDHWVPAVEAALAVHDGTLAAELIDLVQDRPPGLVTRFARAELLRLRALAQSDGGDPDAVERDLLASIDALAAFGAVFRRAQAELSLAEHLHRHGRDGAAQPLADAAAATFDQLGALPWLQRARALAATTLSTV